MMTVRTTIVSAALLTACNGTIGTWSDAGLLDARSVGDGSQPSDAWTSSADASADAYIAPSDGPGDAASPAVDAGSPSCIPTGGATIRLACVGDSITSGFELDPSQSYPSVMKTLLGDHF